MFVKKLFVAISIAFSLEAGSVPSQWQLRAEELVKHNPGQMSNAEYTCIADEIEKLAPCNVLVFGVGRDSQLWIDVNCGGTTLFLEDSSEWIEQVRGKIPDLNAHEVVYNTFRSQWRDFLKEKDPSFLMLDLPESIRETKWDVILVDGPAGYADDKPGRMRSIYTAAQLGFKSHSAAVFLHDCNRPVEAIYSSRFLGDEHLIETVGCLRFYRLP